MSWHSFFDGDEVELDNIVSTIKKRINSGKVKDVEGKKIYLSQVSNCGYTKLVYAPNGTGWGNTPLNPNNWRTSEGDKIS